MASIDIIKNAIGEGMKELMRQTTLDEITVTEICDKVGLSRRNFYRYFQDKYEVVQWIYYHDALMHYTHYEGWSIWDYMPRITQTLYSDRKYYVNAFKSYGQNSFRNYCIHYLRDVIAPDYRKDFPDEKTFDFFVDHVCNMSFDSFILWLSQEPCLSPEEFTALFETLFMRVCRTSVQLGDKERQSQSPQITFEPEEPSKK